jgi:hypothetical protein
MWGKYAKQLFRSKLIQMGVTVYLTEYKFKTLINVMNRELLVRAMMNSSQDGIA